MNDDSDTRILEKLKKPIYGFAFGIGAALGGERFISYMRRRYNEHRENEMEELAEKVIKKYRQETGA